MKTTSMTGFGQATLMLGDQSYRIEIKTLNSKGLDIQCRWGESWSAFEAETLKTLQKEFIRGKITLQIYQEDSATKGIGSSRSLRADILDEVWGAWQSWLVSKNPTMKPSPEESTAWLELAAKHPLLFKDSSPQAESASPLALDLDALATYRTALNSAIRSCQEFRQNEGRSIALVIQDYLNEIRKLLTFISENDSKKSISVRQKINEFLDEWKNPANVPPGWSPDPLRLEQEILFYLEKKDISEELVRLGAHLELAQSVLENESEQGRKLGFVAQEIGREVNTIGSKASDFEIQHRVVMAKEWLEKIKEQAANLL
ncbi:MAG: YicC family protein [Bacteroidia bacterium]